MIPTAFRIEKKLVAWESVSCEAVNPAHLGLKDGKVREYAEEHPFPQDPKYSFEDLLGDLHSEGMWTFSEGIKRETLEWIALMLNALV